MLTVTLRGLRTHLVRLIATLLAILLGVGFMIGTQVLGDTLKRTFDDVFGDVYADIDAVARSSSEVAVPFGTERAPADQALAAQLSSLPEVAAAEGVVEGFVRIIGPDGKPTGNPNGGPPTFGFNWLQSDELRGWDLIDGRAPAGPTEIVLDRGSANDTGFRVGDAVTIDLTATGPQEFVLVGVASFGELDDFGGASAVLFDTPTAQALLGQPDKVTYIPVAAADGVGQQELVTALRAALPAGNEAITGADFIEESAGPFRNFIDQFTRFITIFGYIALFVGGFIIFNTFNVIVAQRTRELAMLRAIGASARQVLGSVIAEAALVGLLAGGLGIAAGIVLATALRAGLRALGLSLPDSGLVIEPGGFVLPVSVALVVTLLSAALPAWRAARVPPIAALSEVAVDRSSRSIARLVVGAVLLVVAGLLFTSGLSATGEQALLGVGGSLLVTFMAAVAIGPLYARPLASLLGAPLARLAGITGVLARENARRNPARTATTAAALTISVGLVTVIAIAASSATASINKATRETLTSDFIVSGDSFQGISPQLAVDLDALPEVAEATGVRVGGVQSFGQGEFLLAIEPAGFLELFDLPVVAGSLEDLGPTEVAVSTDLAERRAIGLGDAVPLTFSSTGGQFFTVGALFRDSPLVQGSGLIVSHEAFDANYPATVRADLQVFVQLADGVTPTQGREALEAVVGRYPTAELQDLEELQDSQAAEIDFAVTFLYSLLFLSVVISLIGVVNTLLLAVYERVRELGLLRAVGTVRGQVAITVLQESVIIALIGTFLGLVIGLGFGWALVQALNNGTDEFELAFALPVPTIVVVVLGAVVAGVLAGVYPAWRAGRLDVLEAIATE